MHEKVRISLLITDSNFNFTVAFKGAELIISMPELVESLNPMICDVVVRNLEIVVCYSRRVL